MTTPNLNTYARNQAERRERQMQTAFPARVLSWQSSTNTVRLEPQFVETWVTGDGETQYEEVPDGSAYIDNVPVLYPRSGDWSITFPIETGSFGLVICTKYSLDAFRNQGNRADPGDLRRFTMSGAVFHPVNLHPNSSALSSVNSAAMELGNGTMQFAALANLVATELGKIKTELNTHQHTYIPGTAPATQTTLNDANYSDASVASTTVKVSE